MPETRTIEISIKQILAGFVILTIVILLFVAVATSDSWMELILGDVAGAGNEVSEKELSILFIPLLGSNSSTVATLSEKVARAYYTIDYRDQEGWLQQLEPYATTSANELLRTVFTPTSFAEYKKAELVIKVEQVIADDLGILKQGSEWQIRLVNVHIDDPPRSLPASDLEMRLLLVMEDGTWKYHALLTEEEVASFSEGG